MLNVSILNNNELSIAIAYVYWALVNNNTFNYNQYFKKWYIQVGTTMKKYF